MIRALAVLPVLLAACSAPAAPPAATSASTPVVDTASGAADSTPRGSAREERAVRSAARRFLRAYLAFSYGHGADALVATPAAPGVVAALVASPPEVPAPVRRREPRIARLDLTWLGPDLVAATASVADGAATYPVSLRLSREADGFVVVELEP